MDTNTIVMLCFSGYLLVAIILVSIGANFEEKAVGECKGDYVDKEIRYNEYNSNVVIGSLLWPISIFVFAVMYLIEFIKEKRNKDKG